ncbi:MAG TPA: hypothetical protein VH575_16770 [Gemmataceae bacterium]
MKHSEFPKVAVVVVMTCLMTCWLDLSATASEPHVAFEVSKDRLRFALTHDEKPVANAGVRVFDGILVCAVAESGPDGRGEFVMPSGRLFSVEIKIGDRTVDRIFLKKTGDQVFPSRVLLSFGLAPCCRMPSRGWAADSQKMPTSDGLSALIPSWLPTAGVVGIELFVVVTVTLTRFSRREQDSSIQKGSS